jgi:hypothetical protein
MGNPFTATSVTSYNANPPSDDGAQTPANRVQWSTQKTKLSDPLKVAFDASEAATATAFSRLPGGAGIVSTALSYAVQSGDQGALIVVTGSGGVTITTPDATVVGNPFVFRVLNLSSSDIILDGSGSQTVDGVLTVAIPSGAGVSLDTDGTKWLTDGQNFAKPAIAPQGRLTLVSGTPVIASDQTAKTSVFYTPYIGDLIPIPNGTALLVKEFAELTLSLVSNHVATNIYDVFVFLDPADNATVVIGTGPAWSVATAGSGSRGTGAGTTELARLKGILVNNVAATMRNGSTTYSVGAKSAIYVGSIFIDTTNGQVNCHVAAGQSRKWDVWNAFNRVPVCVKVFDATASWTYGTATFRSSNNAAANNFTAFSGLAEEETEITFDQFCDIANSNGSGATLNSNIGIGVNSTTTTSGLIGTFGCDSQTGPIKHAISVISVAKHVLVPSLGINTISALESGNATANVTSTYHGAEANMLLKGIWRG